MRKFIQTILIGFLLAIGVSASAQSGAEQICLNSKFDKKVSKTLSHTVDFISPVQLSQKQDEVYIIDTRELEEYKISHIPSAHYASYSDFDIEPYLDLPRDTTLVVYCSIGYRSEKIGEQLQEAGFTKVFNLYGSLFEWANQGYPMVDQAGEPTSTVHTYNKQWSQWVNDDGKIVKVW